MKSNNLKLSLSNKVIFRAPRLSLNATLEDSWIILKEAIINSSPVFYQLIKHIDTATDISQLPLNIQYTIWKYFNRAKFRSTPFGSFAGFGTATLSTDNTQENIVIDDFLTHEFAEWDTKFYDVAYRLEDSTKLISNSSYYVLGDSIRYLRRNGSNFELSEIPLDETVLEILGACTGKLSYAEVSTLFSKHFSNLIDLEESLSHLINLQLLFTDNMPNIIGQDYFDRGGIPIDTTGDSYRLSEIITSRGSISIHNFKHLPELVTILCELLPHRVNQNLARFKADFIRKFEMREVPLMMALDPEVGISYGNLETTARESDFIEQLKLQAKKNTKDNVDILKNHLSKELQFSKKVVDLESCPLSPATDQLLPNTITALLSDTGTMLCIDSLGGATATAMAGRFTLASEDVLHICRDIKDLEMTANPDVIFFDIGYQSETHVDNINRRKCIYDYQLSILDYDTTERPLSLNDILVSVSRNEIMIRSKSLNKRLVPRLSSAYNYSRSDLALFRMLCDLQHQGMRTNFLPNLSDAIPDLLYYPRLVYKNLIVSRAKWRVAYSDLHNKNLSREENLKQILNQMEIPLYFRAGAGDQTLLFNRDSNTNLRMLVELLRRNKELLIEEAFLPTDSKLIDGMGNPYCCEYMVSLQHNNPIYKASPDKTTNFLPSKYRRILPPGREWLYFEIYSHPQRADEILLSVIYPFLKQYHYQINDWFFIRFNDPDDHIRLRIRLTQVENLHPIISQLSSMLEYYIQNEIISDFGIKTYKREMERYGLADMQAIEKHFCLDSQFVISIIGAKITTYQQYWIVLSTILFVRDAGIFEDDKLDDLLVKTANAYTNEHGIGFQEFKEINKKYKEFNSTSVPVLSLLQNKNLAKFRNSLVKILGMHPTAQGMQLFANLMHMHVNRIFPIEQRINEMMIYQYVVRKIKEDIALANKRA